MMATKRLFSIALLLAVGLPVAASAPGEKVFIFRNASRDIEEFRAFAKTVSRLKAYGEVQIDIGVLATKARFEFPEGGSPWHEYAATHANLAKFFPHPKIAPHLPAAWVASNRALLLAKAAVLRELGLAAALSSNDTHFLPESFFVEHPHLRGPRVDHPRRSRREEFSWCVDQEETREMIEWMAAEMKRHVPEIKTLNSFTNDSGSGICWSAALYSGPNGPRHCRHRNAGVRVRDLMLALHRGFEKGGGKVVIRIGGNLWQNEEDVVLPLLPPDTYISQRDPGSMGVSTLVNDVYPVLGLINPLAVLASMERYADPQIRRVNVNTMGMYGRFDEPLESVDRLVSLIEDSIKTPARGLRARLAKLGALAARWGGERNADQVFEGFYRWDEALRLKQAAAPRYSNIYCGVSMRHITRPLVIRPDLLSGDEESYFLPHVFNIHRSEARGDYIDLHGTRVRGPAGWTEAGLPAALAAAVSSAQLLEKAEGAPEAKWLKQMATSIRMWASEVRSIHNFYFAQMLRDRNREALDGPSRIPNKLATWEGDRDFIEWTHIQRDEFDNANELIALLENGGLAYLAHARTPEDQDTFLLGPDVTGDLRKKVRIMRKYWLDVQGHLASPMK